jgi:hypothetical protein
MLIREIADLLKGDVLCGEHLLDEHVYSACGCDLMSDALAFTKDPGVMLTGLLNPQVVRTAEMMDIRCLVFVRGKIPDTSITDLACGCDMAVLTTKSLMYDACGMLYSAGLPGAGAHE